MGAGAALGLSPLMRGAVRRVRAADPEERFLVVLTAGNGWGHQGMDRRGEILDTRRGTETDWDLPAVLEPLAPWRARLSIVRNLNNRGDRSLHGSGWSTLNGIRGDGVRPSAVSLDRLVARERFAADPFDSLALGISARRDRTPPCVSSDGRGRPYPAIGSPVDAYARLFGAAAGGDPTEALGRERSLLDGMMGDVERASALVAGAEQQKLEQLLESQRSLERQLGSQLDAFAAGEPPAFPGDASSEPLQDGSLHPATVSAFVQLIAQAFGFGLSHVAHLSLLGRDAHNVGWGSLDAEYPGVDHGGDAHENLMHVSGYTRERADRVVRDIIHFQAARVAELMGALDAIPCGDTTVGARTTVLWVNSGGGKHHDGGGRHPMVIVSGASELRGGVYLDPERGQHTVNQAFTSVARAMGVGIDCIGSPEDCPEPLPGLS